MSPGLRPDLWAGLPFATSATVTWPDAERSSQAPVHAAALAFPSHEALASAVAALAPPQWLPPAKAGMATARASTAAAEAESVFFMFPSGSWVDSRPMRRSSRSRRLGIV